MIDGYSDLCESERLGLQTVAPHLSRAPNTIKPFGRGRIACDGVTRIGPERLADLAEPNRRIIKYM